MGMKEKMCKSALRGLLPESWRVRFDEVYGRCVIAGGRSSKVYDEETEEEVDIWSIHTASLDEVLENPFKVASEAIESIRKKTVNLKRVVEE